MRRQRRADHEVAPRDAIELLTQQHSEAKDLFAQFEQAEEPAEQERIAREATQALRAHTANVLEGLEEHHADEEEDEMFPQVRSALGEQRLQELGERMQERHDELMDAAATDGMTREELYERAKELDVEGRSQMSKRQLANAVQSAS